MDDLRELLYRHRSPSDLGPPTLSSLWLAYSVDQRTPDITFKHVFSNRRRLVKIQFDTKYDWYFTVLVRDSNNILLAHFVAFSHNIHHETIQHHSDWFFIVTNDYEVILGVLPQNIRRTRIITNTTHLAIEEYRLSYNNTEYTISIIVHYTNATHPYDGVSINIISQPWDVEDRITYMYMNEKIFYHVPCKLSLHSMLVNRNFTTPINYLLPIFNYNSTNLPISYDYAVFSSRISNIFNFPRLTTVNLSNYLCSGYVEGYQVPPVHLNTTSGLMQLFMRQSIGQDVLSGVTNNNILTYNRTFSQVLNRVPNTDIIYGINCYNTAGTDKKLVFKPVAQEINGNTINNFNWFLYVSGANFLNNNVFSVLLVRGRLNTQSEYEQVGQYYDTNHSPTVLYNEHYSLPKNYLGTGIEADGVGIL
jgi:hypothetical protein